MVEIETNENLNIESSSPETLVNDVSENIASQTIPENIDNIDDIDNAENTTNTAIIEYKEVEEPCVALTIIGENKLTDTQVFLRRGIKYSIKAFFSAVVLTIMNMFI